MQLSISNFQYWISGKFSFPPQDLYHISGPSESGKTTIFRAIMWVLYGRNSPPAYNLYHKTKMTTVEMILGDVRIYRRTRPATLEIAFREDGKDIKLSGPEATSYIDANYGSFDLWRHTCYCSIDKLDSFFLSSSANVAEYFEKMSFPDSQLSPSTLIERINANLNCLEKDSKYIIGRIEQTESLIRTINIREELENEFTKGDFSLQSLKENLASKEKEHLRIISIVSENNQKLKRIEQINKEIESIDLPEYDDKYELYIPFEIDKIRERRQSNFNKERYELLRSNFAGLGVIDLSSMAEQERLKITIKNEMNLCDRLGIDRDEESVRKLMDEHSNAKKEKILREKLSILHASKPKLGEVISKIDYPVLPDDEEKRLTEDMKDYLQRLEVLMQNGKGNLECPHCEKRVYLEDGLLKKQEGETERQAAECVLNKDNISLEISTIKSQLETNERNKRSKIEQDARFEVWNNRRQQEERKLSDINSEIDKINSQLNRDINFGILSALSDRDVQLLSELKYEELQFDPDDYDEYLLQASYKGVMEDTEHLEMFDGMNEQYLFIDLPVMIKMKKERQERLRNLNRELESIELEEVEETDYTEEIIKLKELIEAHPAFEQRLRLEEEIRTLMNQSEDIGKKISLLSSIKEKAVQKESEHLSSIICSITSNMNIILSQLFEGQLTVEIASKKVSTNNRMKRSMNLGITRNGVEIKYSQLSEGTKARLKLALSIAQGHLSKFPYILVDEMLSTLDDENYENCIECIKSYCDATGKRVLKISHTRKPDDNCLYIEGL